MPEPDEPFDPTDRSPWEPDLEDADRVGALIGDDFTEIMRWFMDARVVPSLHWARAQGAVDTASIRRVLAESMREVADFIEDDANWSL